MCTKGMACTAGVNNNYVKQLRDDIYHIKVYKPIPVLIKVTTTENEYGMALGVRM